RDDRVEAREQPGRGEQVGQDVDALAQLGDAAARPAGVAHQADAPHDASGASATTVTPATTRSPLVTRGVTSGGRKSEPRNPKMFIPNRSPRASWSPGRRQQRMRRASAPAIWTTT